MLTETFRNAKTTGVILEAGIQRTGLIGTRVNHLLHREATIPTHVPVERHHGSTGGRIGEQLPEALFAAEGGVADFIHRVG